MNLILRLARPQDFSAINRLRLESYQAATWFSVNRPENLYNENDPQGVRVLVAFEAKDSLTLIGTMGVAKTASTTALEEVLGAAAPAQARNVPVLTVMRLAVSQQAQGGGLNHAMRQAFLRAALSSNAVGFCSSQAIGTPNVPAMEKLGYEFREVPSLAQKTVKVSSPTLLVNWLPKDKYAFALEQLDSLLRKKDISFDWQGPELVL